MTKKIRQGREKDAWVSVWTSLTWITTRLPSIITTITGILALGCGYGLHGKLLSASSSYSSQPRRPFTSTPYEKWEDAICKHPSAIAFFRCSAISVYQFICGSVVIKISHNCQKFRDFFVCKICFGTHNHNLRLKTRQKKFTKSWS